ncbi:hypothetical protein FHS67_005214 [Aminobacter aminovorans]|uniref:Uncharacterized protein n=1 Tax=Aminobacter aminovorans TaxID=83263 RepID=A0AAC8YWJ2_AMIAI|nr:hypothetical protein AA2016_6500 [Aminobacter aminovorans]MBB3708872.1 hypothetical protein [Aminobacter aminovorans]
MFQAPIATGDGATPSPIRLRVLSLGAGVQSTTLALLAAQGIVGPMRDCAIFADTGWEPASVYAHLRWLMSANVLPFPVYIVSAGNIRDNLLDASGGERWASVPAFMRTIRRGAADHRLHDGFRCWRSVRDRTLKAPPCGEALGGPSHRSTPDRRGPGIHQRCAAEAASNSRIKST